MYPLLFPPKEPKEDGHPIDPDAVTDDELACIFGESVLSAIGIFILIILVCLLIKWVWT